MRCGRWLSQHPITVAVLFVVSVLLTAGALQVVIDRQRASSSVGDSKKAALVTYHYAVYTSSPSNMRFEVDGEPSIIGNRIRFTDIRGQKVHACGNWTVIGEPTDSQ